jgi:hypothetical protein
MVTVKDNKETIYDWRQQLASGSVTENGRPIARLFEACTILFQETLEEVVRAKHIPKRQQNVLKRNLHYLRLWGADIEVGLGELDEILRRSFTLRKETLRLLASISRTLCQREYIN